MKKAVVATVALSFLLLMISCLAAAETDDHRIVLKYDLNGSFDAQPDYDGGGNLLYLYNWGGLRPELTTWRYSIHIKGAANGDYSVGSIHFVSKDDVYGNVSVTGRVELTRYDYEHWQTPNLLACGTTQYKGKRYFFMFLYSHRAMWLCLSDSDYKLVLDQPPWIWDVAEQRLYQFHTPIVEYQFPWEPKEIH